MALKGNPPWKAHGADDLFSYSENHLLEAVSMVPCLASTATRFSSVRSRASSPFGTKSMRTSGK